jgi:hypothetical protein
MRGLLTEGQARAWAEEMADELAAAAEERADEALSSLSDAEDSLDHVRARFRKVLRGARAQRNAQRAEIARLRADLGGDREILLLRRLEREVRRAYGPSWEQENFSGEEVGRILDAIDVTRTRGGEEE